MNPLGPQIIQDTKQHNYIKKLSQENNNIQKEIKSNIYKNFSVYRRKKQ
jgi:hypothetical protein